MNPSILFKQSRTSPSKNQEALSNHSNINQKMRIFRFVGIFQPTNLKTRYFPNGSYPFSGVKAAKNDEMRAQAPASRHFLRSFDLVLEQAYHAARFQIQVDVIEYRTGGQAWHGAHLSQERV